MNENLQSMPGVESVAFSTMPILRGFAWQNAILGKDFEGTPIEQQPFLSQVSPDYFATLGIPVLAGRAFTPRMFAPSEYNAPSSMRPLPGNTFPGRNPIGQRFGLVNDMKTVTPNTEVIGVIADKEIQRSARDAPCAGLFSLPRSLEIRGMTAYVRTQADPRVIEDALRERLRQFDPHVAVVTLETVNEQIGFSLRTERLVASLSAIFGV